MPLIVMCGTPCSGKTRRAKQIRDYVLANYPQVPEVRIINEETFEINKQESYSDPIKEKSLRGFLRSNVDKHLNPSNLVILDSLNYIKGFRYELYCLSRTAKSTYCVVYCDLDKHTNREFNEKDKVYTPELLEDLINRMERPVEKNRWDNPLFVVEPEDELPYTEICKALFEDKKKSKDPVSTKAEIKLGDNYVYEVDKVVQDVIDKINKQLNENRQLSNNKFIKFCEQGIEINMKGNVNLGDLKKLKNEFLKMNKMNPFKDPKSAIDGFMYYIKSKLNN